MQLEQGSWLIDVAFVGNGKLNPTEIYKKEVLSSIAIGF